MPTVEIQIQQIPMGDDDLAHFTAMIEAGAMKEVKLYAALFGDERLTVLCAYENLALKHAPEPDWRWHLSIAGRDNVPSWRALTEIAHKVRPGVTLVLGVPPRQFWLNIHPHVLHLWSTKDENLEAQWVFEGRLRRDEPS